MNVISKKGLLFFLFIISVMFFACKKDKDNNPPAPQDIVTYDTSAYTGKLTVRVYNEGNTVPENFNVFLFASRQDLTDNIYLYHVPTNSIGISYFGYINYGNYYVKASGVMNSTSYESDTYVVQVRPRRDEWLNISVRPPATE